MPKYLFSYDQENGSFPERYRVVGTDEDAAFFCKTENLTGTILDSEALDFLDRMMARHQSSASITVEFVDAPQWKFVELRYNPAAAEAAECRSKTP